MAEPSPVWALVPLAAGLVALAAGFLVSSAAAANAANRRLAFVLGAESLLAFMVAALTVLRPTEGSWPERLTVIPIALLVVGYARFLGTLPSRWAVPLAAPWSTVLLGGVALVAAGVGLWPSAVAGREWILGAVMLTWLALPFWGLFIVLEVWRKAPLGSAERTRARWFALAFGLRDAGWGVVLLSDVMPKAVGLPPAPGVVWIMLPSFVTLAYIPCLAYGMMRHQVLGLDVQLRRGIEKGTIVMVFVVAFVVGNEVAKLALAPAFGPAAGIVAAGLVGLALIPLQRASGRLAALVVPPGGGSAYAAVHHPVEDVLAGRFRVVRRLGAGSMGTAFLAEDAALDRLVVVKVVDAGRRDQVLAEGRALARVRHPNVVAVYDVRTEGVHGYLVLEYVAGGSLRDHIDQAPLDRARWMNVARALLEGLAAIHDAGLVHRDIKPANVLLDADDGAKVADLGIVATAGDDETMALPGPRGAVEGTMRFMSPEQARGDPAAVQSDLYSAAAVLFEAWTGRPYVSPTPYQAGPAFHAVIARGKRYPKGSIPDIALDSWFEKALQPAPGDRFQSARAMAQAIPARGPDVGWSIGTKHAGAAPDADHVPGS